MGILMPPQGGTYGDFIGAMLCVLVIATILGWAFCAVLRSIGGGDPPDED